jgi:hypothetical protein
MALHIGGAAIVVTNDRQKNTANSGAAWSDYERHLKKPKVNLRKGH